MEILVSSLVKIKPIQLIQIENNHVISFRSIYIQSTIRIFIMKPVFMMKHIDHEKRKKKIAVKYR